MVAQLSGHQAAKIAHHASSKACPRCLDCKPKHEQKEPQSPSPSEFILPVRISSDSNPDVAIFLLALLVISPLLEATTQQGPFWSHPLPYFQISKELPLRSPHSRRLQQRKESFPLSIQQARIRTITPTFRSTLLRIAIPNQLAICRDSTSLPRTKGLRTRPSLHTYPRIYSALPPSLPSIISHRRPVLQVRLTQA